MTKPKYATRRDRSEKPIVKTLRQCGVSVYLLDTPCDALLGYRGSTYLAEFKTPGTQYGKGLNDNQKKFNDNWHGGELLEFRDDQDVIEWVNSL